MLNASSGRFKGKVQHKINTPPLIDQMFFSVVFSLCGYPPFDDSEEAPVPIYQQMIKSQYSFPSDPWNSVSVEGVHVVKFSTVLVMTI